MATFESLGQAATGVTVDFFDRMPQTIAYNGDGTVNTITATGTMGGTVTVWIKTFGYTNGKITSISEWVKQ